MNFVAPRIEAGNPDQHWNDLPVYLRQACEPIRRWLEDPDVIEIIVNRPGMVFVESTRSPDMECYSVPELDAERISRIAEHIAGVTNQSVNQVTPLLSAAMPHGERFQGVLSPAAPDGGAFSIRKQVTRDLSLDDYLKLGTFEHVKATGPKAVDADAISELDAELLTLLADGSPEGRVKALKFAVANAFTIVIAGGTSSGKTTFLNALLKEVPNTERIISIEDTRELQPRQPNYTALVASKGSQGLAHVTVQDLLEASLRMRPDRLLLGEIRGADAFTFLQGVNTGHPGSMSTVHANSPREAIERIALAAMQAGLGLTKQDITEYIRLVVPIFVQLRRRPTRGVSEIYFRHHGVAA